jgi:hypothetical protein
MSNKSRRFGKEKERRNNSERVRVRVRTVHSLHLRKVLFFSIVYSNSLIFSIFIKMSLPGGFSGRRFWGK